MKKSDRRTAEFVFWRTPRRTSELRPSPQSWWEASLRSSMVPFRFCDSQSFFFFFCFSFKFKLLKSSSATAAWSRSHSWKSSSFSFVSGSAAVSWRVPTQTTSVCFTAADLDLEVLQYISGFHTQKKNHNTLFIPFVRLFFRHIWYLQAVNLTHLVHFSTLKQMQGNVIQGFLNTEA